MTWKFSNFLSHTEPCRQTLNNIFSSSARHQESDWSCTSIHRSIEMCFFFISSPSASASIWCTIQFLSIKNDFGAVSVPSLDKFCRAVNGRRRAFPWFATISTLYCILHAIAPCIAFCRLASTQPSSGEIYLDIGAMASSSAPRLLFKAHETLRREALLRFEVLLVFRVSYKVIKCTMSLVGAMWARWTDLSYTIAPITTTNAITVFSLRFPSGTGSYPFTLHPHTMHQPVQI